MVFGFLVRCRVWFIFFAFVVFSNMVLYEEEKKVFFMVFKETIIPQRTSSKGLLWLWMKIFKYYI